MAVLSRTLVGSAQRLDLPDLKSIEAFMAGDMKYLLKGFAGDTPYVLNGFDILDADAVIGTSGCSVRIAESAVYFPNSTAGAFFYGLPVGNVLANPLAAVLNANATNYIYAVFTTSDTTSDVRAYWDPDLNGGDGGELTQEVNTATMLSVTLNTSVSTFPDNTISIAKVVTDSAGNIISIEDCRNLLFRLGSGGLNPDANNRYDFRSYPSSTYQRNEPPTKVIGGGVNPFQGGDKNIYTLKEWMDVVMTKLAELTGTPFWYQQGSNISISSVFGDTLGSTLKSKGTWQHDSSIAGKITWTDDIIYKSLIDLRDIIIRQNTVTLANDQVAFINLIRGVDVNSGPVAISFINGVTYINGVVETLQNLFQGDWVKKKSDSPDKYCQVKQFYDAFGGVGGGGSVCVASSAKSVELISVYNGATEDTFGCYSKGIFGVGDVQITSRNDAAIQTAGGDYLWLAARSDTVMTVSDITTHTLSGTVTANDGTVAEVNVTSHTLRVGDRITATIPVAGTFVVTEIIDANNFAITVSGSGTGAFTGYFAIVTTTTTVVDGIQKESSTHGFESNETIQISGTTNYNGSCLINYVSATSFQIPVSSALAHETAGFATGVRVDVRKAFGSVKVVQGESVQVGEVDGGQYPEIHRNEDLSRGPPYLFVKPVLQHPSWY